MLEVGHTLAGAYAAKLLADLGAHVVFVEPPSGHALRRDAFGSDENPVFGYVRSGCGSEPIDLTRRSDRARLHACCRTADIVVESLDADEWSDVRADMMSSRSGAGASVHISPFGRQGPYGSKTATGMTLQAAAGWSWRLRDSNGVPLSVGGHIEQYGAGVHAAVAALSGWRQAIASASWVEADLSIFECLVAMLPYPTLQHDVYQAVGLDAPPTVTSLPGVVSCRDGWVGVNPINQQGWNDLCALVGAVEFCDRLRDVVADAALSAEFHERVAPWFAQETADSIVDVLQAMRIPSARVVDGRSLLHDAQFAYRDHFVAQPGADFARPRAAWRFSAATMRPPRQAPGIGQDCTAGTFDRRTPRIRSVGTVPTEWGGGRADLPFSGLKVLDLTAFWAGPIVTMYLASLGADVVKVESHRRPDPFRYSMSSPAFGEDWSERSPVWQGTNAGKRSLAVDLTTAAGQRVVRQFADRADVLIENFTPRVLGHLGLDPAMLLRDNPRLIVLRMPAFGLDGPFANQVAWAPTLEQASGLAQLAGGPDHPPVPPGGCADALAGMHSLLALIAALEQRELTGEGQLIEAAQLDALVNVSAEQVIRASLGQPSPRLGNRHACCAPHGIYPCAGPDEWIAIAIEDDIQWHALRGFLGTAVLGSEFDDVRVRLERHDELDGVIASWTQPLLAGDAELLLQSAGVPAERLRDARRLGTDEQLLARGYFERVERPATGVLQLPRWPMRFSFGPEVAHHRAAPTLGEHTDELLRLALGLGDLEIAALRTADVIA